MMFRTGRCLRRAWPDQRISCLYKTSPVSTDAQWECCGEELFGWPVNASHNTVNSSKNRDLACRTRHAGERFDQSLRKIDHSSF